MKKIISIGVVPAMLACVFLINVHPAQAAASISISSASLASDGKTLTVNMSGVTGSLSPATGITGLTVDSGNTLLYAENSATSSGSVVTVVLAFPIAQNATTTITLSTSSNLTDTASDTPAGQTGVAVTNNSTRTVTAFNLANGSGTSVAQTGYWIEVNGSPNFIVPNANSGLDFTASGTDVALVGEAGVQSPINISVDGATSTTPTLSTSNLGAWSVVPLSSGLSSGQHTYAMSETSQNMYVEYGSGANTNGSILVAGSGASISAPPSPYGTSYFLSTAPFSTYGAIDGDPATTTTYAITASSTVLSAYSLGGGQDVRFTSNSSFVAVWAYELGYQYLLYQDGVLISTSTMPAVAGYGRLVLASGLDTTQNHEYEIIINVPVSSLGGAALLTYIELDHNGIAPVAHTPKLVDGFYGDSITYNLGISNAVQGDAYILSQGTGRAPYSAGTSGSKVSTFGRDNTANIPTGVSMVWVRYGINDVDVTTLGAVGTPGTFIGDYYTMLVNIRARIGAGKPIVVTGLFPTILSQSTDRPEYNAGIQTAIAAYKTNTGDTNIYYFPTDNWFNPTNGVDTVDGIHPNASGYAKIANREFPIAASVNGGTGYTITGPSSGLPHTASASYTVTTVPNATFTGDQTITLSDGGNGGTFTPSIGMASTSSDTITPATTTTSFTFTYTPASSGMKTITTTNGQLWTDPAPISYAVVSAPTVSVQSASSIGTTNATLNGTITSNNNASSTVEGFNYGLTTAYGSVASSTGTYGTGAFSQTITGLTPSTTYHFQAFAINSGGTGTSTDQTFTTSATPDTTPPIVQVTAPTSGATVSGSTVTLTASSTDNVAVAGVTFYINGTKIGSQVTSSSTIFSTTWNSTATSSGSYSIVAVSVDTSNNSATSSPISFTVSNAGPVFSSISSGSPTQTTATITWTTNEAATSKIDYGLSVPYSASTTLNSSLVTSHSVTITGLTAGTLYHYEVRGADGQGNLATSSDQTFTTASVPIVFSGGFGSGTSGQSATPISSAPVTTTVTSTSEATLISELSTLVSALQARGISVSPSLLTMLGMTAAPSPTSTATSATVPSSSDSSTVFTRSLTLGSSGADVHALQVLLNDNGFEVSASGVGSKGKETDYFGPATRTALIELQKSLGITPAQGYFGAKTRAALEAKGWIS